MDQPSDKDTNVVTDETNRGDISPVSSTRRRFTRNAVLGGGVVFSLSNRAAWAADPTCMSTSILESFNQTTGTFASAHPLGNDHIEADAVEILSRPNEQYTDPDNPNGICVP